MQTPGHRSRSRHLYIALTEAVPSREGLGQRVLLVGVSSARDSPNTDETCILNTGDHSFIARRSYVFYARARVWELEDLEAMADFGITAMGPVAPHVLDRICAGLEASPNTPETVVAFYREAERLRLNT